jgi:hypothetical protein
VPRSFPSDPDYESAATVAAPGKGAAGRVTESCHRRGVVGSERWDPSPSRIGLGFPDVDAEPGHDILIGEGGYDGLIAVFRTVTEGDTWDLHGYIIEGEFAASTRAIRTE